MSFSGVRGPTDDRALARLGGDPALGEGGAISAGARAGAWLVALSGEPENLDALRRERAGWAELGAEALFAQLCAELGFVRASERLEGDLNLAALGDGALWLRRGMVGREPLVTVEHAGNLYFSTRPRSLAAALGLAVVEADPPRAGLSALRPGEHLRAGPAGVERRWAPRQSPAGRAGNPEIWAKALENAVTLAVARARGGAISSSGGVASAVLEGLCPGARRIRIDPRSIDPLELPALSAALDAPLPDPTLLLDAAALREAGGALLSGRGAAEILGARLSTARRARLFPAKAAGQLDADRLGLAGPLGALHRLAGAAGVPLRTPYATALVLGVASIIPAEHLRGRALLGRAFAALLPPALRERPHEPPAVPLAEWLRALGESPADPLAWRRAAWKAWRAGLP